MDSPSQTSSTDNNYNATQTSTDHDYINDTTVGETSGSCGKDQQELMFQLKGAEQQLEESKHELKELEANAKLALKKAQILQAKTVTDELETKLGMAESEKIDEAFPLPNVYYYIKGEEVVTNLLGKQKPYSYTLYADKDGNLLTSLDGQRFSLAGPFRFTKHPAADGTFSIFSLSQENYLKCRNANGTSLNFCAKYCSKNDIDTKFELSLLQHEDKQPAAGGISVDIRSLTNDCFLSKEENSSKIVANSPTAPPNKFLFFPMLWKSFPLLHLCYYIKLVGIQESYFLYADKAGNLLLTSWGDRPFPRPSTRHFKFTKHPDDTFSIYSMSQEKYLESKLLKGFGYIEQTAFNFSANDCSTINTKFELFLLQHEDTQLASGILVDIRSLANGRFLSKEENYYSHIMAISPSAPSHKFLIIPVDGQSK